MAKIKHVSAHQHRLKFNPLERRWAKAWKHQNDGAVLTLYDLLRPISPAGICQRDATVAATVVQWLGSPVGQDFVKSVLRPNSSV